MKCQSPAEKVNWGCVLAYIHREIWGSKYRQIRAFCLREATSLTHLRRRSFSITCKWFLDSNPALSDQPPP